MTQVCTKCGIEKDFSEFHKCSAKKNKKMSSCKKCNADRRRNKTKMMKNGDIPIYVPLEKSCSKCGIIKPINEFSVDNSRPDRTQCYCKKCQSNYVLKRRKTDEIFYLSSRLRNLVLKSIQRMGYTKRSKTNDILGIDFDGFKKHIESKFAEGMNWDNRELWHIDHIIPISSAKTEEEVIKLNHYTNLQPLWAEDNYKKSDKLNYEL